MKLFAEKRRNEDLAVRMAAAEFALKTAALARTSGSRMTGGMSEEFGGGAVSVSGPGNGNGWRIEKLVRVGKRYASRVRKGSK